MRGIVSRDVNPFTLMEGEENDGKFGNGSAFCESPDEQREMPKGFAPFFFWHGAVYGDAESSLISIFL